MNPDPLVGIIMGSASDWKTMGRAFDRLTALGIKCEKQVVSAHRTPDELFRYAETAADRGISLIIAGAGGAAHLPGMTAAKTIVPVIGVPVEATPLRGVDALLSIMQMPAEIGVATVGIGAKGADQAALFAARIVTQTCRRATSPHVAILWEGESSQEVLRHAEQTLNELGISFVSQVAGTELDQGAGVFIVVSSAGTDLARRVAATTSLPVLNVPIVTPPLASIDQFVQPFLDMPDGVATFAVNRAGAINAALFAASILSAPGSETRKALQARRDEQVRKVLESRSQL